MISGPPQTTILEDVDFIKSNYIEYFEELVIEGRSDEIVEFYIRPIGDRSRKVAIELNRHCYKIVGDSEKSQTIGNEYESLDIFYQFVC